MPTDRAIARRLFRPGRWKGRTLLITLWAVGIVVTGGLLFMAVTRSDDLWRTAIPGLATAAGTGGLAIATGYLALRENARRREDLRSAAALDARKVVSIFTTRTISLPGAAPPTPIDSIRVVNASTEPVFDLTLVDAVIDGEPRAQWHPTDPRHGIEAVLLPGAEWHFDGSFRGSLSDQRPLVLPVLLDDLRDRVGASFSWTDGRDQQWLRIGGHPPEPGTKPAARS